MDIRILGLGNVLMGDDGFGPYVIETLAARYDFPANVSVIDVGTPGLDLAPFLIGADAVIIVDTVRADAPPGTVRIYRRDAILKHAPQPRLSPHDPGLKQTLLALDFADRGPADVTLIGVVPQITAPCARLSAAVRGSVDAAVDACVAELELLGAEPALRNAPPSVQPWWEAAA
jgi:hydrogenase maturation protease